MMEHAIVIARPQQKMVLVQRRRTLDTIYTNIHDLGVIFVEFRIFAVYHNYCGLSLASHFAIQYNFSWYNLFQGAF